MNSVPEPWELRHGPRDPVPTEDEIIAFEQLSDWCEGILNDDAEMSRNVSAVNLEKEYKALFDAVTALDEAVYNAAESYGYNL